MSLWQTFYSVGSFICCKNNQHISTHGKKY